MDIHLNFDPLAVTKRRSRRVNLHGLVINEKGDPDTAEVVFESAGRGEVPQLEKLQFYDPSNFVAGKIHNYYDKWHYIFENNDTDCEVREWVQHGVDIFRYIQPFKGKFWGEHYDADLPPRKCFNNSNKCRHFVDFINDTIADRLKSGAIECVGKVGQVDPPHIIAPLVVEPSKPRLCINLMFLNSWTKDVSFSLDTLKDIPRVVGEHAFFTSLDDKSGFDNIFLTSESRNFVGFQWAGYYFRCLTLPFGYKLSSYIYHTLNMQPTAYIRKRFAIPVFMYIDDRLVEEARKTGVQGGMSRALVANYIVCEILIRLGYCINLSKSVFTPTQIPVFLGFFVDSVNKCFRLTNEKKQKFALLREQCLDKEYLSVLELQQLAGKCISFMLAVPGAKLYTREMNRAISLGCKSNQKTFLSADLREEIQSWRFLDNWDGQMVWKKERHLYLEIVSDASTFKWGGVIFFTSGKQEIYDFWGEKDKQLPIMVLEAKALLNVLISIKDQIQGQRLDAGVDNMALLNAWKNEGCKSRELNVVLKEIFELVFEGDIVLNLIFVKSSDNAADDASRVLKKSDASLSMGAWYEVQRVFGGDKGHTVDLMSLDSNCMTDIKGKPLKHFTPFRTPGTDGINVFSQDIGHHENCYVFPPFNLISPVINFIAECKINCTLIVPAFKLTQIWQLSLADMIIEAVLIGSKGQKGILRYPSKRGYVSDKIGLPFNIWAVRFLGQGESQALGELTFGKFMYMSCPASNRSMRFLGVGDSMIRFLSRSVFFSSPMSTIKSLGGALVHEVNHLLKCGLEEIRPGLIFVHTGVNNLSKNYLYKSEFQQIQSTLFEMGALENTISQYTETFSGVQVIFSSVTATKDGDINARALIINEQIKECCARRRWHFMDNNDIDVTHLRDTVHLNSVGETILAQRLKDTIRRAVSGDAQ